MQGFRCCKQLLSENWHLSFPDVFSGKEESIFILNFAELLTEQECNRPFLYVSKPLHTWLRPPEDFAFSQTEMGIFSLHDSTGQLYF